MQADKREQLSLLMDGQLSTAAGRRLLAELRDDADLRAAWTRYHVIQDGLQDRLPARVSPGFAARVSATIEQEPLAFRPRTARYRDWRRPVFGIALAASVVGAVVLAAALLRAGRGPLGEDLALAETTVEQATLPIATLYWSQEPARPARLTAYLVNHSQIPYHLPTRGAAPRIRLTAHGANPE
ncbi:MAG: sigma-E factor negative regulatory protein [Gammaproteobacteria bacterium]